MSLPTCYIAGLNFLTDGLTRKLAPFYTVNPEPAVPQYAVGILNLSPYVRYPARGVAPVMYGINDLLEFIYHGRKCSRIYVLGDVGAYGDAATPFEVDNLWDGYPRSGWSGMLQRFAAETLREECSNALVQHVILDPIYGPDDDFTPCESTSVAALIESIVGAASRNQPQVKIYGECLRSRTHLHVDDAAAHLLQLILDTHQCSPRINIGGKTLLADKELVNLIRNHANYTGELVFDDSYPDDMSDSIMSVGPEFEPRVKLVSGIAETVKWYREQLRKDA